MYPASFLISLSSFIISFSNACSNNVYDKSLRLVGKCISFGQHSGIVNLLLLPFSVVGGGSLQRESLENLNRYGLVIL